MKTRPKKIIIILLVGAAILPILSLSMPVFAIQQAPAGQTTTPQNNPGAGGLAPNIPPNPTENKSLLAKIFSFDTLIGLSSGLLLFIAGIIGKLLGFLFSWIIYFEAWILDTTISGFNITNSQIVKIGWGVTRDLANMAFILSLIIIAISTILRVTSYAAKQIFWRVIVAALLVNFSLIFGGVVIDASQMLAKFFVNAATGGDPAQFSIRLANALDITAFYNPGTGSFAGTVFKAANQIWVAPAGIILGLIALVVMVFVFGAAAFFMLVRVIWLWILLILAPFAWAALAFPGQSKYFNEWWQKLFHWAFFAPVFTFFMWLSLQLFQENGKLAPSIFSSVVPALESKSIAYVEASAPEAIMQFGLMVGLMVAALIVAKKFGVYGANASLNTLKGWGVKSKDWAGRKLRSQALGIGAQEAAPGVPARPGLLVRGAQKLAAVPGGRLIAGQVFKMQAAEMRTVEEAQKQFANWTSKGIQEYLKQSPGPITNALFRNQQIGAALALKEKGDLEDLGEPRIRELAALASREYSKRELREMLKVAPHLAPEFNEDMRKMVGRIEKADDILIDSLRKIEVVAELNPQQLQTIVQKADPEKITVLRQTVENAYNTLMPSLSQKDQDKIKNDIIGAPGQRAPSRETRNKTLRELIENNPNRSDLEKIVRNMLITSSPAWQI